MIYFDFNEDYSMTEKTHKLDLFKEVLPALYRGDYDFYSNLSEEDKKGITPVTLMRWLSSVKSSMSGMQIEIINEYVNKFYNSLYKEPELMWRLMVMSTMALRSNGRIPQHEWISSPKQKNNHTRLQKTILDLNPTINQLELDIILRDFTKEDYKNMLNDMGIDDKTIKDHLADYKKHYEK